MRSRKKTTLLVLAAVAVGGGVYFLAIAPKADSPESPAAEKTSTVEAHLLPDDKVHAEYAGSETCQECHRAEFENWQHSNHGLAERNYSKDMDEKTFSPRQTLTSGKVTSKAFLDADGVAKILTLGYNNETRAYPIVRIIGNDPLRQFLIPAPGGRLQACDISYDPKKNELFNVYGTEERLPGDWGHWTGQGMNWNAMCAACHNTRLRKNYQPTTNSYNTKMAEMTVSCEACHGPMKKHVEWQKNPPPGLTKTDKDPTIFRQTRDQMIETCAACHARRGEVTGDLIPGESFYDHFNLVVTDETDIFHPDGQVRDENYEYTSFVSSRMHHVGIRCVDCHEPHTGKRILEGNALCMRCHAGGTEPPATVIDPLSHGHHAPGSAGNDCTSCHMPVTTYMQRHPRHDHGFTIPDPLLTVEFGTPNACNRCHTDKDPQWALDAANEWYGEKLDRPTRTRAQLIARARQGDPAARDGLIALLKTEPIPAWRASFCHLLELWSLEPETITALIRQLKDESPLVREAAVRSLIQPVRQQYQRAISAITPLLDDPSRSVRVSAAWALVATLELSSKAGKELVHLLDLGSDQPTGRMQLSQFAYLRGQPEVAIKQLKKAISWDPLSPPFHHDLGILLSTIGDIPGAIDAMKEASRLDPENPEYHYKLALAYNESGNVPLTIASLRKTVELDPSNARAWYNLGLALNGQKQTREAIEALTRAEQADPYDAGIPYALATIYAAQDQRQPAIDAVTRALQIRQDFPEALQLLHNLSRR
ncbi:MAG: tetratricopeptide repeat protein [Luteolibacter sp.]